MLKNFDELKKQLTELATVINLYKSEAVQLKIVERVLQGSAGHSPSEDAALPSRDHPPQTSRKRGKGRKASDKPAGNRPSKLGAVGALNKLIDDGFFKTKRSLNEILAHCRSKLAKNIKPNEMSGPLARFIRNGNLDRDKNKEGQFEYFSKSST